METQLYPLTSAQKEILSLELDSKTASNVNTLCGVMWFLKDYKEGVVEKAVNLMVEYQQGLRLSLCKKDGIYMQYENSYTYQKLTPHWYEGDEESMEKIFQDMASHTMQLLDCPLCRFHRFASPSGNGLVFLLHHVIADGSALMQLALGISDYCRQLFAGETILPKPLSFTDYALKEASSRNSKRLQKDQQYWQEMYQDWQGLCRLNPKAPVSCRPVGKRFEYPLPETFTEALLNHCREHQVQIPLLFQAGLILYLHQQNPRLPRIDIGQNIQNRSTGLDKMTIGLYSCERMLCVPISDEDTLESFCETIRQSANSSYYHGLCLHDEVLELVKELHPEVLAIRDVEFSYLPPAGLKQQQFYGEWINNDAPETSLEFTVSHINSETELEFIFDYLEDAFTEEQAIHAARQILTYVTHILHNPDKKIGELMHECV